MFTNFLLLKKTGTDGDGNLKLKKKQKSPPTEEPVPIKLKPFETKKLDDNVDPPKDAAQDKGQPGKVQPRDSKRNEPSALQLEQTRKTPTDKEPAATDASKSIGESPMTLTPTGGKVHLSTTSTEKFL